MLGARLFGEEWKLRCRVDTAGAWKAFTKGSGQWLVAGGQ